MAVELDWDLGELDEEDGLEEPHDLEESLLRYRSGGHDVRLDVPIAEQARDEAEALALADVVVTMRRHLNGRIETAKQFAEAQKALVDQWLMEQTDRLTQAIERIDVRLHEYALDYHGDTKTVKLPHGTLRRRAYRDAICWESELEAQQYQAQHYPEDMKLSKSALKERLEQLPDGSFVDRQTGEVVHFVKMVKREGESFSVTHEEVS